MRRVQLFIIVLIVTIAVLVTLAFVSWYLATSSPAYYDSSWMKQMWSGTGNTGMGGGMMGNGGTTTTSYLWIIPVVLGTVVAVAVIGVAFYLAFPELKYIRGSCVPNSAKTEIGSQTANQPLESSNSPTNIMKTEKVSNSCDVILKTMTPEEKKVLNVLVAHQGKYLQKYVSKEAGLSRLKTHRIVARFAQRGIVTVKEFGNTNEIVVSEWVKS
jgi:uncharacterized membrane protein